MDNRYYTFTRDLNINIDEYIDDIIVCVENKVYDDYDISYRDIENSIVPNLMKDITKKLAKKYLDKT